MQLMHLVPGPIAYNNTFSNSPLHLVLIVWRRVVKNDFSVQVIVQVNISLQEEDKVATMPVQQVAPTPRME